MGVAAGGRLGCWSLNWGEEGEAGPGKGVGMAREAFSHTGGSEKATLFHPSIHPTNTSRAPREGCQGAQAQEVNKTDKKSCFLKLSPVEAGRP